MAYEATCLDIMHFADDCLVIPASAPYTLEPANAYIHLNLVGLQGRCDLMWLFRCLGSLNELRITMYMHI